MSHPFGERERLRVNELSRAIDKDVSTIYRWTQRGVRGHVLGSYMMGGQRYVDRQDFVDFLAALNTSSVAPPAVVRRDREERLHRVEQELDRAGL